MSLDAIGIVSENPAKSVKFYRLLDVDLEKFGDHDHFEGTTSSGIRLMLDSVEMIKKLRPEWQKPTGSGIVLCFKQSSPQAVDELFNDMIKFGFQAIKTPWDAFWGQRYACISDPDGNQVDLFASR